MPRPRCVSEQIPWSNMRPATELEYKIRRVVAKLPGASRLLTSAEMTKPGLPRGSSSLWQPIFPQVTLQQMVAWVMTNATVIIIVIMDSILVSFN